MSDPERSPGDTERQVLVVIRWPDGTPVLRAVAQRLNTPIESFDESFGIVLLDPERRLWSARACRDDLPDDLGEDMWIASDPPIEGRRPG